MSMPSKIKVEVTEMEIQNGARNSYDTCPVALAFKRALVGLGLDVSKLGGFRVGSSGTIRFEYQGGYFVYYPPLSVYHFINSFDRDGGEHVYPFSFEATL